MVDVHLKTSLSHPGDRGAQRMNAITLQQEPIPEGQIVRACITVTYKWLRQLLRQPQR